MIQLHRVTQFDYNECCSSCSSALVKKVKETQEGDETTERGIQGIHTFLGKSCRLAENISGPPVLHLVANLQEVLNNSIASHEEEMMTETSAVGRLARGGRVENCNR